MYLLVNCIFGSHYCSVAGKERDGAAVLFGRLMSRPDVPADVFRRFFQWCSTQIALATNPDQITTSTCLENWDDVRAAAPGRETLALTGVLQALLEMLKQTARENLKPHLGTLQALVLHELDKLTQSKLTSGLIRKLRVACACRTTLGYLPPTIATWRYDRGNRQIHTAPILPSQALVSSAPTGDVAVPSSDVPEEVEEALDLLLKGLRDDDTVVRWAAAKGIGRISMRLPEEFSDQVLEYILELFDPKESEKAWQGGCLALAELTRRGLLLPSRLQGVISLIIQALQYDVRQGSHTAGAAVRDAACYVCWSFGRAYSREDIKPYVQTIAAPLLQVCTFDREVNCRRAASAAFQENVGRQGLFEHGIAIVQITDYFALATMRSSYLRVAPLLSDFPSYGGVLLDHLVQRKLSHPELDIRVLASRSMLHIVRRIISRGREDSSRKPYKETILKNLNEGILPVLIARCSDKSVDISSQHGALLGVAALVQAMRQHVPADTQKAVRNIIPIMDKARMYCGRGAEILREAACRIIQTIGKNLFFCLFP